MKYLIRNPIRLAAALGLACFSVLTANLQAGTGGVSQYLTVSSGVAIMNHITDSGVSIKMKDGIRVDVTAGCTFYSTTSLNLSGEIETGIIYNSFDSASGFGTTLPVSGHYYQMPLLVNGVLAANSSSPWIPSLGFGAGMVHSNGSVGSVGSTPADVSGSETDAAIQVKAGLHYRLNSQSKIGLEYKYLVVFPSDINSVGTHSIALAYSFTF
jgi:opacity protein-like surface antigen